MNSSVEWRRNKVQELASQGYNQSEISRTLQISQSTINRDIAYLRQQAKSNIKRYIDERLPEEYENCWIKCNHKRSMEHRKSNRGQERKDTGIVIS
jgi:DeoR/GlpR family transcriptional regulator of sugar metabolism